MGAFRKAAITCLLIVAGTLAGCGDDYGNQGYPGTRHTESIHVYDYAEFMRAQNEGAYLDHLKRQEQMKSWDRTLDSFTRSGHKTQSMIGKMAELKKRRSGSR